LFLEDDHGPYLPPKHSLRDQTPQSPSPTKPPVSEFRRHSRTRRQSHLPFPPSASASQSHATTPSAMAMAATATSRGHLVLSPRSPSSSLRQQVILPARTARPIAAVARRGVAAAAASSPAVAASSGIDG
jgi:hypothetical protein